MGRIVVTIDIKNITESGRTMKLDALVDTDTSYLTLPHAWKELFGKFSSEDTIELQNATQKVVKGLVCGPVKIKIEGFRSIYNEVLFIDMEPENGEYEPLLGYIALEQCGAAVDMIGHRLLPVKYMDVKYGTVVGKVPVINSAGKMAIITSAYILLIILNRS